MAGASAPDSGARIRALLTKVRMGTEINRYEFSVAAARRAREIHVLTAEGEARSQQKSLRAAIRQITSSAVRIVREKDSPE